MLPLSGKCSPRINRRHEVKHSRILGLDDKAIETKVSELVKSSI